MLYHGNYGVVVHGGEYDVGLYAAPLKKPFYVRIETRRGHYEGLLGKYLQGYPRLRRKAVLLMHYRHQPVLGKGYPVHALGLYACEYEIRLPRTQHLGELICARLLHVYLYIRVVRAEAGDNRGQPRHGKAVQRPYFEPACLGVLQRLRTAQKRVHGGVRIAHMLHKRLPLLGEPYSLLAPYEKLYPQLVLKGLYYIAYPRLGEAKLFPGGGKCGRFHGSYQHFEL